MSWAILHIPYLPVTKLGSTSSVGVTFGVWEISLRPLLPGEPGWVGFHYLTLSFLPVKWE